MIMSNLMDYLNQLDKAHDAYENHFGKGSLEDSIPYFDPVHPDLANIKSGIELLRQAIKNNKPLPKLEAGMKDRIIY